MSLTEMLDLILKKQRFYFCNSDSQMKNKILYCDFKVLFLHNNHQSSESTDLVFKIFSLSQQKGQMADFSMSIDLLSVNINNGHYNIKTQGLFYYFIIFHSSICQLQMVL